MYPPPVNRYELGPGLVADTRRALWLEADRTLVVADIHLGHLWVERQRGALLPIVPDDTLERLLRLRRDYAPRAWIFLGDTVHAPARLTVLEEELHRVVETLRAGGNTEMHFVLGNHDRHLPEMLERLGLSARCVPEHILGSHLFVHGDAHDWPALQPWLPPRGRVVHGHQHPALVFGDDVTTTVKAPCFLVSPRRIVLPAFSRWAAHVPWNSQPPLSPLTADDPPETAVAILGDRLLPMNLRDDTP
jgi:metallophosphoesterase superfamily enzyme